MRLARTLAPLAGVFFATACLEPIVLERTFVGLMTVRAFDNEGTPVVRGTAAFYDVNGLQLFTLAPSPCSEYVYSNTPSGLSSTLSAGSTVNFTVQGLTEGALSETVGSFVHYKMRENDFLNFASGDTVTVNTLGTPNGFEASESKVRLAEAFTAGPIPDYVASQALDLTWTPAVSGDSYMVVSLRYANAPGLPAPNREIECVFADDGTGSIPAALAQLWGTAEPSTREYLFTRAREVTIQVKPRMWTRVRSNFEVPTPTLVVPPT